MVSTVYCPDCGAKSSSSLVNCAACGTNLPAPILKNPLYQKVAPVKPKAAVFDLDGTIFDNFQRFKDARRAGLIDKDGKPMQKGRQSIGAAWKKRNKFLYSKKNLAKDTVIPGSKELISSLTNDGYIIIYLTARPRESYNEVLGQLESNGFPLFRDSAERVMLITKPPGNMKAAAYKGDEVRKLRGEFDVRMVFDDDLDALAEISKYDVPGLYSSVSDHVKVNPRVKRNGGHIIKPEAHDFRDGQYVTGTDDVDVAYDMLRDPDDPDGRTVGETSGRKVTVEDVQTKLDDFGSNPNMITNVERLRFRCENGHGPLKSNQLKLLEPDDPMYTGYGSSACPICGTSKMQVSVVKKLGRKKLGSNPKGFVKENPVNRGKDSKGSYYRWGKGAKYYYKTGSEKSRNAARKKAYEQAKAAYAGGYKKNPAHPKKVEKGKKLYKHMNGQEPEKINVEKIDIGDVWYKVGEGGCWQIGYISGKDNGRDDQKYIHTFNEETKDGNFPELYATMPKKGKPMLIIKGGTWKIKTDDKGVAWIYD